MSSILSSRGMVLATAMVVSGTTIFLSLFRERNFNSDSSNQILRSCLSNSSGRKRSEMKTKIKNRVRFADNVKKDSKGSSEEFRKQRKQSMEVHASSCGIEFLTSQRMPANRVALYSGILKDRMHRMACSQ